MKKYFPYLMMSALLALTACSSEGDEPQATELIPLTFVSEMGDDQTVITRYGSNVQSTQLVSGTKVGIYLYDAKNKVSTTGAGTYATNRFNKKNIEFTANGSGGWSNSYSWFWPENGNSVTGLQGRDLCGSCSGNAIDDPDPVLSDLADTDRPRQEPGGVFQIEGKELTRNGF